MGFQFSLLGAPEDTQSTPWGVENFSVQEDSTPLAAGDASGSVGSISATIPAPDRFAAPNNPVLTEGLSYLLSKNVRVDDTRKGFTLGKIHSASESRASGLIETQSLSRLGELNVYNVQADPYSGTLAGAFAYYMSLANVSSGFEVDPSIGSQSVVLPGWNGELWFNLKQFAAALDCDISLVSGVIVLRPIRARTATKGRDLDRTASVGGGSLAQNVEVYQYNNRQISGQLVYPPGGWSEDVTIINVNAGETVEEVLELSASLTSVVQPQMMTFVSQDHVSSSVFTAVGDDGLPISPTAWSENGGSLSVSINPDTTSLTVKVTAPTGLPNKDGRPIEVYGIALESDFSTGRYSTLRILGSGVAFNKELKRIPTGVTPAESATEVGVTIDNPFLSTASQVATAGIRAVRGHNGSALSISGNVIAVNQLGETGEKVLRPYSYDQTNHGGQTYAQVQTTNTGVSYLAIQEAINAGTGSDYENQVFGNVAGARVWDEPSKRWYRIRSATLAPDTIQFEAEDDLTHQDYTSFVGVTTYDALQTQNQAYTYREMDLRGLR